MCKSALLGCILFSLSASTASARDLGRGFSVGATAATLGQEFGTGALTLSYDLNPLQFELYTGFVTHGTSFIEDGSEYGIAGGIRAYYAVHATDNADFSLGLGVGGGRIKINDGANFMTGQAGARVRIFLVDNVALMGEIGLSALVQEGEDLLVLSPNLIGGAGLIYYFN